MKVSVNWLKQFTDIDIDTPELVEKIGAQLGAVEEVIDLSARYEGIYIVHVVSCEKHPNADKLTVCFVDDGGAIPDVERNSDGHVQVVCGAPNVQENMLAVWLPPGSVVPKSQEAEPFKLDARELRGVMSHGMLASARELAIGESHDSIVSVDIPAEPGSLFAEVYELDDTILDIENKMFTHRPDCFGILGVAREIAGIQGQQFTSPKWYMEPATIDQPEKHPAELRIDNTITDAVPRFMAITLDNIEVKPSPFLIQSYLARIGIRPINNVVDATNYVMALTGQPLHAYDADKLLQVTGADTLQLEARYSRTGDSLTLIDGKEINFEDDSTILITSHDVPVGIGGIMGGASTEVDENTKRIVLECANFDMYAIRRASMRHGLFTDAVTRFNKGQSPLQNQNVLREAVATLQYVSGATVASEEIETRGMLAKPITVDITPGFIEKRLGMHVTAEEVKRLLTNVEFQVRTGADSLEVTSPFWRTDIAIAEDIVEEVGRLIGFDALPLSLPHRSIEPVNRNAMHDMQDYIRDVLAAGGANEVLTYSFISGDMLKKTQQDEEKALRITNALSPDLHFYRMSLTPSLLGPVRANIKAGYGEFAIFEVGKVHLKTVMSDDEPVPAEHERLALVYSADDKTWQARHAGAGYYQARKYLDYVLSRLGIQYTITPLQQNETEFDDTQQQLIAPYHENRSGLIMIGDDVVGIIGELKQPTQKKFKLPRASAAFELDTAALLRQDKHAAYTPLSKYPKIQQDISFKLPANVPYTQALEVVEAVLLKHEHLQTDVQALDIYQPEQDAASRHIAFRITAWSEQRTMTNQELSKVLGEVAEVTSKELDAVQL